MSKLFLIGFAGLAGTLGRYWISEAVDRRYEQAFPWGTLVVNLSGCLLAGFLFYLMGERNLGNQMTRSVIFVGLLGAFTTFSSVGLQSFALIKAGEAGRALFNITASNLMGLMLVWAGYSLAKVLR